MIYPSKKQFYCAAHLECYPHYTVADGPELFDLVRSASCKGIHVHIYRSNRNYCDDNVVQVINNVDMGIWKGCVALICNMMLQVKNLDKER